MPYQIILIVFFCQYLSSYKWNKFPKKQTRTRQISFTSYYTNNQFVTRKFHANPTIIYSDLPVKIFLSGFPVLYVFTYPRHIYMHRMKNLNWFSVSSIDWSLLPLLCRAFRSFRDEHDLYSIYVYQWNRHCDLCLSDIKLETNKIPQFVSAVYVRPIFFAEVLSFSLC